MGSTVRVERRWDRQHEWDGNGVGSTTGRGRGEMGSEGGALFGWRPAELSVARGGGSWVFVFGDAASDDEQICEVGVGRSILLAAVVVAGFEIDPGHRGEIAFESRLRDG